MRGRGGGDGEEFLSRENLQALPMARGLADGAGHVPRPQQQAAGVHLGLARGRAVHLGAGGPTGAHPELDGARNAGPGGQTALQL